MSRIKKSSINLISSALGYMIPTIVVFLTTPLLLNLLGKSAYGINNLSNTLIGYFTIMDLNIDIALIKYLAEDKSRNDDESINRLLNLTLKMYLVIGLIGMTIIFILSD